MGQHKQFTSWFHLINLISATRHMTPPKERPSEPCCAMTPPRSPRSSLLQDPESESGSLTPRLMAMASVDQPTSLAGQETAMLTATQVARDRITAKLTVVPVIGVVEQHVDNAYRMRRSLSSPLQDRHTGRRRSDRPSIRFSSPGHYRPPSPYFSAPPSHPQSTTTTYSGAPPIQWGPPPPYTPNSSNFSALPSRQYFTTHSPRYSATQSSVLPNYPQPTAPTHSAMPSSALPSYAIPQFVTPAYSSMSPHTLPTYASRRYAAMPLTTSAYSAMQPTGWPAHPTRRVSCVSLQPTLMAQAMATPAPSWPASSHEAPGGYRYTY